MFKQQSQHTYKHISQGFIAKTLHSYNIDLLDLNDMTKIKPEITPEEKHMLNIEGYKTGTLIKKDINL